MQDLRAICDVPGIVYCVPTALSALTHTHVSKIYEFLIEMYGMSEPIKSVQASVAVSLMNTLGYDYEDYSWRYVTKHSFKDFLTVFGNSGTYLVFVRGHAIAVKDGFFFDNHTPSQVRINGGHYCSYPFLKYEVVSWYSFKPKFQYPWSF